MFEQTFKNIDGILFKNAGADSELGYVGQTSLIMFPLSQCCLQTAFLILHYSQIEHKINEAQTRLNYINPALKAAG